MYKNTLFNFNRLIFIYSLNGIYTSLLWPFERMLFVFIEIIKIKRMNKENVKVSCIHEEIFVKVATVQKFWKTE